MVNRFVWVLAVLLPLWAQDLSLEFWPEPVSYGSNPSLVGDRFFIFDVTNDRVKAYRIGDDWRKVSFLWQSKGRGQGPGEIPHGAKINNIALDQTNDHVWVSHTGGFTIFDEMGRFVQNLKRAYNRSWVLPEKPHLVITSPNFIRARVALVKVGQKNRKAQWKIDSPTGLPVMKGDKFLRPNVGLYEFDDRYYSYDSSIGELLGVDKDGAIQTLLHLKQTFPEVLIPERFDENYKLGAHRTLGVRTMEYGFTGLWKDGPSVYLFTLHHARGFRVKNKAVRTVPVGRFRLLERISLDKHQSMVRLYHPLGAKPLYLLQVHQQQVFAFDQEEGNRIHRIPLKDFETVVSPVF